VPHDFYHLPGYVRLAAEQEGGWPLGFVAEQNDCRLFVPLILRRVPLAGSGRPDGCDATGPYGYGGPVLQVAPGQDAAAFLERAWLSLRERLRQMNVVSVFLRLHPLLPVPLDPLARSGCLVRHGETVSIDLTLPAAEIWGQTRANHRRGINQAKRRGDVAEIDADWTELNGFYEIYTETMRRVGAADTYFFDEQHFLDLKQAVGEHLHLCVVRIQGTVACAGLFSEVQGIVQYHLGGTRDAFLVDQPSKTMFDYMRHWAKERGNRVLHLGGGVGGRHDNLFHFKAGFSKGRTPFYTWRSIVDPEAYGMLVRRWEASSGETADGQGGFFPPYRKGMKAHPSPVDESRAASTEVPA